MSGRFSRSWGWRWRGKSLADGFRTGGEWAAAEVSGGFLGGLLSASSPVRLLGIRIGVETASYSFGVFRKSRPCHCHFEQFRLQCWGGGHAQPQAVQSGFPILLSTHGYSITNGYPRRQFSPGTPCLATFRRAIRKCPVRELLASSLRGLIDVSCTCREGTPPGALFVFRRPYWQRGFRGWSGYRRFRTWPGCPSRDVDLNRPATVLPHQGIRVGEIIGYRAWRVFKGMWIRRADDRLHSVHMERYVWDPYEPAHGDVRGARNLFVPACNPMQGRLWQSCRWGFTIRKGQNLGRDRGA
jgi:hypothetical protein